MKIQRSKNVDSWIYEHDPAIRQIAMTLRNIILSTEPTLNETIRWGSPTYEKKGKVCYITATDYYVTLGFFNGAMLTNEQILLGSSRAKLRSIKVRSLEDIDTSFLRELTSEAVSIDNQNPILTSNKPEYFNIN